MEQLRKIVIRIVALVLIVLVLNVIYKKTFWMKDLDNHADMLYELLTKQDTCDMLYFGESSDFHTDSLDTDKRSISRIAADHFPTLKVGAVTRPAMHAGMYCAVVKHLSKNAKVKTVIFTLNLRSFDATWINSSLESYLLKTKIMYQTYPAIVNRFLFSLNVFENKSEKEREQDMLDQWEKDELKFPYPFKYKNVREWDKGMADGGFILADGSWDQPKIDLACHYIKAYAFQIDTLNNPRLRDFDEIVEVCKEKDLNIVFNLLAENVQYADSLVGKDLIYLMHQTRDLLVKRYTSKGVLVVDNLEKVNGKDFVDQHWTTEHYNQIGRKAVGDNLANGLKKFYLKEYKNQ
ncbi:MAG: hypothetical protein K0Q95_2211 [Bacteroidota bacterium]|jgi:hypothetical protein|nr:hypothetical protein [Bacteroidota bacterium]